MGEKLTPISEWSDEELMGVTWLRRDDPGIPEAQRDEMDRYKNVARRELRTRGYKSVKLSSLPPDVADLLRGNVGQGNKLTAQYLRLSDEEFDALVGRYANTELSGLSYFFASIRYRIGQTLRKLADGITPESFVPLTKMNDGGPSDELWVKDGYKPSRKEFERN